MSNRRVTIGNSPALQRLLQERMSETGTATEVISRAADFTIKSRAPVRPQVEENNIRKGK